jgi:hypothetical protein
LIVRDIEGGGKMWIGSNKDEYPGPYPEGKQYFSQYSGEEWVANFVRCHDSGVYGAPYGPNGEVFQTCWGSFAHHFFFYGDIRPLCGDGVREGNPSYPSEECDGSDMGGITQCTQLNPIRGTSYLGGALSCSSCQYDTSNCINAEGPKINIISPENTQYFSKEITFHANSSGSKTINGISMGNITRWRIIVVNRDTGLTFFSNTYNSPEGSSALIRELHITKNGNYRVTIYGRNNYGIESSASVDFSVSIYYERYWMDGGRIFAISNAEVGDTVSMVMTPSDDDTTQKFNIYSGSNSIRTGINSNNFYSIIYGRGMLYGTWTINYTDYMNLDSSKQAKFLIGGDYSHLLTIGLPPSKLYWTKNGALVFHANSDETVEAVFTNTGFAIGSNHQIEVIKQANFANFSIANLTGRVNGTGALVAEWKITDNASYIESLPIADYNNFSFRISGEQSSNLKIIFPTKYYWRNSVGDEISKSNAGDTVHLSIEHTGLPDGNINASIYEESGVFIRNVSGINLAGIFKGTWQTGVNHADRKYFFNLSAVPNQKSALLEVALAIPEIKIPKCGNHFFVNENFEVATTGILNEKLRLEKITHNEIQNKGEITSELISISESGNYRITVTGEDSDGNPVRLVTSIMIVNQHLPGRYVSACIDEPKNLDNIQSGYVKFNASSTRGINYTMSDGIKYIDKKDIIFNWTFSEGSTSRRNPYTDGENNLSWSFHKLFIPVSGNWAELEVKLKD